MAKAEKKNTPKKTAASQATGNTSSSFALDDGIDVPARSRQGGVSPYPFATMKAGQSFHVPHNIDAALFNTPDEHVQASTEESRKIANRLSGATRRFTKANDGSKFAVRTVEGGVRVWRTE